MIRVVASNPPPNYAMKVHIPGQAFLRRTPAPNAKQWGRHSYWKEIHTDLWNLHSGVCMYCASWSPRRPNGGRLSSTSVDHFVPKSVDASRAYEWANFRLARSRLNHRKDNFQDVIDPFLAGPWFELRFSTFLIEPAAGLPLPTAARVQQTIDRLGLNSDEDYVKERISVIRLYSLGRIPFAGIVTKYPFIAQEIQRQNFDQTLRARYAALFSQIAAPT